ncbi:MAG: energy transducer TonB [Salinivenus sp.]
MWPDFSPARTGARHRTDYTTRVLVGYVLSLSVLIGLAHLSFSSAPSSSSQWTLLSPPYQMHMVDVQEESSESSSDPSDPDRNSDLTAEAPPQTGTPDRSATATGESHEDRTSKETPDSASFASQSAFRRLTAITEVKGPELIGGLRAYYLHIQYPEPARKQGIQGRLMLSFDVNENGTAEDINVTDSLHPLLDSAAVSALQTVRFRPATRHGAPVSMPMKLPVRFRILSDTTKPHTAESRSSSDSTVLSDQ